LRNELESLDDSMLRDIGLSRREAEFEASTHIWMNLTRIGVSRLRPPGFLTSLAKLGGPM
jgi:Domain of unknown function (DUF1127)